MNKKIVISAVMVTGFALCVAVACLSDRLNAFDKYEITSFEAEAPVAGPTPTMEPVSVIDKSLTRADAVAYLHDNKEWVRPAMERYTDLAGLWDAMNTYDFTAIKKRWMTLLDDAGLDASFSYEVNRAIKMGLRESLGERFNEDRADSVIVVNRYILKLTNNRICASSRHNDSKDTDND